jgi:hypothetical protein
MLHTAAPVCCGRIFFYAVAFVCYGVLYATKLKSKAEGAQPTVVLDGHEYKVRISPAASSRAGVSSPDPSSQTRSTDTDETTPAEAVAGGHLPPGQITNQRNVRPGAFFFVPLPCSLSEHIRLSRSPCLFSSSYLWGAKTSSPTPDLGLHWQRLGLLVRFVNISRDGMQVKDTESSYARPR